MPETDVGVVFACGTNGGRTQASAVITNAQADNLRDCAKESLPKVNTIARLDSLQDATKSGELIALDRTEAEFILHGDVLRQS
jgi:hypothetical protein